MDDGVLSIDEALDLLVPETVEITDQLVAELKTKGWSEDELKAFRLNGWRYCPARNTVIA